MICLESLAWGWTDDRRLAFLEISPVSDIQFWKPVYQMFKPDEPLMNEALRDFYVRREDDGVAAVGAVAINSGIDLGFIPLGSRFFNI